MVGTGTANVLGLAPDASMEEAKARYKVLMRFWHTDICKLPMPWKWH